MNHSPTESRASQFFDRYAIDFDAIYGNANNTLFEKVTNHLFRRSMVTRYEKTIAGCEPITGRSVIDIGCGPGHYGVTLAKRGASKVVGLDFAPAMLEIAKKRAEFEGVGNKCSFEFGDFLTHPLPEKFDYAIVMGFMDYVKEPEQVIDRVLDVISSRAFFSFPAEGGVLAWQRKLRYKSRCDLYLYQEDQIRSLFSRTKTPFSVERIDRDFFVTMNAKIST